MVILFGFLAFVSTFLGGYFALRFKDKLHLILGFSAGAVVGVAFFDLLPEAVEMGQKFNSSEDILLCVAIGFLFYMILDRTFSSSHKVDGHTHYHSGKSNLRAGSISVHSLLDGVAIGLSFQVSAVLGITVAVAVLAHDFSDGINTVSAVLKDGGSKKSAMKWLLMDAIAPFLGIIVTLFIVPSEVVLSLLLGLFTGFFLYIGASDLVPESFHGHPTKWTTIMTIAGALFIYLAIYFAH